jgi:hypothetical protein
VYGTAAAAAGISGTLKVTPSPVPVCEKTGLGKATVTWTAKGTKEVQIHIDALDGPLFAAAKTGGSSKTGDWIKKGTVFYLQHTAGGAALAPENTLARLEVEVTNGPCP